MKKKLLSTLIIIGFFISCEYTNENNKIFSSKTIKIPKKEKIIKASDIISDMNIIKLEKTKHSYIGKIVKLEFFNDNIFIQDKNSQKLFVFDNKGYFVKAFNKQGKGPGEYEILEDFIIDTENKTLEIFDKQNNKIIIYNLYDFSYIKSFSIPIESVFKFIKNEDYYYFQTNATKNKIDDKSTNSDIIAFNTRTLEITPLFNNNTSSYNKFLEFNNVFYKNNYDDIFVSLAWEQTIYHINKNLIYPIITIDPGNRGIPEKILKGSPDDKLNFILSSEGENKIGGFRLLFHQDNCLILAYGMGNSTKQLLYFSYKDGANSFATKKVVNDFSSVQLPAIEIFKITNGKIISIIDPFIIKNKHTLEKLNVSKYDNPLIVKYELKNNKHAI